MLAQSLFAIVALPALVAAHFEIVYPTPRGTVDDGEATYPCAGYAQTQNRTSISTTSFPLALTLGHEHSLISIFIATGTNPGSSFNYQVQPTVQEVGPGSFCFPSVPIPAGLNITAGTNATIQVVTDGDTGGGLYMCADVTFTTSTSSVPSSCQNGTGLTATVAAGSLANGTSSNSTTTTGTTTSAAASATAKNVAAAGMSAAWGAMGAAMLGAAALM